MLGGYIYNHYQISLVDTFMYLPTFQHQEMPCCIVFLSCLKFIIYFIESACPILLLPKLNTLLCINFEDFSDIHMLLEAKICG